MNADGEGEPVRLTSALGTDMGADWSPDGRMIAFESQRDGNREIYVMNSDGTDQGQVDQQPRSGRLPLMVARRSLDRLPPPAIPVAGSRPAEWQRDFCQ